jgi:hypothetical protein
MTSPSSYIQTIITSPEELGKYCFSRNPIKLSGLVDYLKPIVPECFFIEVKGDGNCMAYAIYSSLYFAIHYNYDKIQTVFARYLNKSSVDEYINIADCIKSQEFNDYMDCLRRIGSDFSPITNVILDNMLHNPNRIADNRKDLMNWLEFKENFDSSNSSYSFIQLGQVISIISELVILNIDYESKKINGIYPFFDESGISLDKNIITPKVLTDVWGVVVIFTLDNRHYRGVLPILGDNIKASNKEFFMQVVDEINWINITV